MENRQKVAGLDEVGMVGMLYTGATHNLGMWEPNKTTIICPSTASPLPPASLQLYRRERALQFADALGVSLGCGCLGCTGSSATVSSLAVHSGTRGWSFVSCAGVCCWSYWLVCGGFEMMNLLIK